MQFVIGRGDYRKAVAALNDRLSSPEELRRPPTQD
jgi:hypothetical protein